jgi:SPP1 gp7 family putative phage head morphogenesis protein
VEEIKRRAASVTAATEFESALFDNMKGYNTGPLGDLLYQAVMLADLAGRAEVEAESSETDVSANSLGMEFGGLPFKEAVEYLIGLTAMSAYEYAKLSAAHRTRAFSIAEQSNADLLEGVRKELQEAVENNMTFRQFLDGMDEVFDKYGVTKLSTRRAELVFRQNVQTAYAVGRHAQMTEPHIMRIRPYWQYVAVRDGRTRPSHRALDGLVFPATHEFWNTHYPPNGYQCRCTVKALSERQVRERGLEVLDSLPADLVDPRTGEIIEDASPDPGFDINPALAWAT